MFMKSSVVGKAANPLFVSLAKATGKAPAWNFHKYLIDRQGRPVASFASEVTPTDAGLISTIEKALRSPAPG
jgi:glutathione peroxidase